MRHAFFLVITQQSVGIFGSTPILKSSKSVLGEKGFPVPDEVAKGCAVKSGWTVVKLLTRYMMAM